MGHRKESIRWRIFFLQSLKIIVGDDPAHRRHFGPSLIEFNDIRSAAQSGSTSNT
uniref:Uncharacterized protein n=1 Tax=Novosphingobium aromaticivorans TaxID=48935 RepID=O85890_NOVAR|nr:unknown [Novosphingobium aromaticivorans]